MTRPAAGYILSASSGHNGYTWCMNKRLARYAWTRLETIKPWYVFVGLLILISFSVYQLRSNNLHMAKLRDAVYLADERGTGVDEALQNLRSYVGQHMNTDLSSGQNAVYPPVQLKYTYDRLITTKSEATGDRNAKIYTDAQRYCEDKIPSGFSGRYRIGCIQEYVTAHNASPTYINADLYKFDFYTPTWSPDLAGFSLLFSAIAFVLFLLLLAARFALRQLAGIK